MQAAKVNSGEIERARWNEFLADFSKRNASRPTRLEVVGEDVGAQELEKNLPLVGISFEPDGSAAGTVEIILGGASSDPRHLEHTVANAERIVPIVGVHAGFEDGIGIESAGGTRRTLLTFEELRELPRH